MEFYHRMRDLREDRNETQSSVAKVLGITQQQYQLYESGKRYISVDLLKNFCSYYGVSSDYILGLPRGLVWPR